MRPDTSPVCAMSGPANTSASMKPKRFNRLIEKWIPFLRNRAYCVAGKVNSVNTLYLVVESVKLDTKHERRSTSPTPADGTGG